MTAPQKPLVMTLGKALSVLQKRGLRLVPPEEGTDSWGTTRIANWDAPDHEFDTWPEAVSDALGRTVVDADAPARDDAAELRAAVKAYFEAVHEYELFRVQEGDGPYPVSDEGDRFVELSHDLADAELHLKTLAATEGSA